jgi:hypothetical protein
MTRTLHREGIRRRFKVIRAQPEEVTADCPGIGQAAPGHLCVYEVFNFNANASFGGFGDPRTGAAGVAPFGTVLAFTAGATAVNNPRGSWSYTAP